MSEHVTVPPTLGQLRQIKRPLGPAWCEATQRQLDNDLAVIEPVESLLANLRAEVCKAIGKAKCADTIEKLDDLLGNLSNCADDFSTARDGMTDFWKDVL